MERTARAYLDGFATARLVLEQDAFTVEEILDSLEPYSQAEEGLGPWKRGYRAAVRSAFGR